jgi:hypothetical protein
MNATPIIEPDPGFKKAPEEVLQGLKEIKAETTSWIKESEDIFSALEAQSQAEEMVNNMILFALHDKSRRNLGESFVKEVRQKARELFERQTKTIGA